MLSRSAVVVGESINDMAGVLYDGNCNQPEELGAFVVGLPDDKIVVTATVTTPYAVAGVTLNNGSNATYSIVIEGTARTTPKPGQIFLAKYPNADFTVLGIPLDLTLVSPPG